MQLKMLIIVPLAVITGAVIGAFVYLNSLQPIRNTPCSPRSGPSGSWSSGAAWSGACRWTSRA